MDKDRVAAGESVAKAQHSTAPVVDTKPEDLLTEMVSAQASAQLKELSFLAAGVDTVDAHILAF